MSQRQGEVTRNGIKNNNNNNSIINDAIKPWFSYYLLLGNLHTFSIKCAKCFYSCGRSINVFNIKNKI